VPSAYWELDDTGARLELTPRKSLKRLVQKMECQSLVQEGQHNSWSLDPINPVIHAFQPRVPASRVHFYSWFIRSVVEGEMDRQLTVFSAEAWCHLQGYINTQNNRYWNSQNPHLTHEIPLHRVKVGVWCAVNVRSGAGAGFLRELRFPLPIYIPSALHNHLHYHARLAQ
jgi:hypothetical protein